MVQVSAPFIKTRYLDSNGEVSDKFRTMFREISEKYEEVARFIFDKVPGRSLDDFAVREVHVVGSVLKGVDNSDIDLLLILNKSNWDDFRLMKNFLAQHFFIHRLKAFAYDVYPQPYDERPENPRWAVTNQLETELKELNSKFGYKSQ